MNGSIKVLLNITWYDLGEHELYVKVRDFYGEEDIEIISYSVSDMVGTLKGRVCELGNVDLAIGDAQIAAADPNQIEVIVDPNMISTLSDPNTGNFQLTLNEGIYRFIVSKPGYETEIIPKINIVAGEDTVLSDPIFLNPFVGLIKAEVLQNNKLE